MTLSERNTFFKAGIVFCAVCTLFVIVASFFSIPQYRIKDSGLSPGAEQSLFFDGQVLDQPDYIPYQDADSNLYQISDHVLYQADTNDRTNYSLHNNTRRPVSFIQAFTGLFLGNNFFAVHTAIILSVLFSLVGMWLIHSFFERTSAPEILYIAIFTMSFAFEAIRLILPLHLNLNFPSVYVRFASRVLLFSRFFCIFSLFTASICAAGLEVQKTRNVIFIMVIASLVITLGVPIDVLNWDTSLNMVSGFPSMFRMIELAAFFTTIISFFIAANIRGTKEYTFVAIGIILALVGRNILLNTDNWLGPVPGILMLSFGTWFLCSKLHKIHLWL
ncbi:MAG: hypothetical protein FWD13_04850 [Treponema sp.]|nr:hypothetical protein [Treponema sp.]